MKGHYNHSITVLLQKFEGCEATSLQLGKILNAEIQKVNSLRNLFTKVSCNSPDVAVVTIDAKALSSLKEIEQNLKFKPSHKLTRFVAINTILNKISNYDLINLGFDEVIKTPICPKETAFRIASVIGKRTHILHDRIKLDNTELKLSTNELLLHNSKVKLTNREAGVLKILMMHKSISLKNLRKELAKDTKNRITENNSRVLMHRVRRKIFTQTGRDIIENRYSHGYSLKG